MKVASSDGAKIKAAKPWVKFGIAPFGIWRPGHPEGIAGFDQYASLYATSASQARAANSAVKVYSEVSTANGTPDQMTAAAESPIAWRWNIPRNSPGSPQSRQACP